MKNVKKQIITEITRLINNEVCKYKKSLDTRGCKNKIKYNTFIKIFINKLETNLSWDYLGKIYNISKSHIHDTFCKWTNYGIFKNSFNKFLHLCTFKTPILIFIFFKCFYSIRYSFYIFFRSIICIF